MADTTVTRSDKISNFHTSGLAGENVRIAAVELAIHATCNDGARFLTDEHFQKLMDRAEAIHTFLRKDRTSR